MISALELTGAPVLNCVMMKRFFTFALLLAASPAAVVAGQISAYEALRTIGRAKGDALLGNLVELRARDGDPQPVQWVASFRDTSARGGIREFTVTSKGITSERTPLQAGDLAAPGTMAASGLNLDSTGVFDATNKAAAKAGLGFNTIDYRLQNRKGSPVWTAQLFDAGGNEVGMAEFSARNGAVVTPLRSASTAPPVVTASPPASRPAAPGPSPAASADRPLGERWVEGGGLFGHVGRWSSRAWKTTSDTAVKVGRTTSDTAVKVGDSVGAFFTGRPRREPSN